MVSALTSTAAGGLLSRIRKFSLRIVRLFAKRRVVATESDEGLYGKHVGRLRVATR